MADYAPLSTDDEKPPPLPPPSSAVKSATSRVASLDVFRGLCVFLMIFVDYGGSIFPVISHAPWNGLHLADFVMPFFLFIAGLSLAIAYKRVTDRIDATMKAIDKAVKLFLLGVFLQGIITTMSTPMERLRQLVGTNNWDYCVLWKLSEDQRFLEFMDCCCGGSEISTENNGSVSEEFLLPCRDAMFPHFRTKTCELLSQFPSSHPLDGINMEILISNQPRWLNFSSNVSDLNVSEDSLGTKVLIPIPGGLVELYAAKQVSEDLNVIDYVMAQCRVLVEQGQMSDSVNNSHSFSMNMNMITELQSDAPISDINNDQSQAALLTPVSAFETLNISDSTNNNNQSMSFLQHFSYENSAAANSRNDFDELMQNNGSNNMSVMDQSENGVHQTQDKQKGYAGRGGDSFSDSDQLDDDDEPKYRRRSTKGPQSKNLEAERKRRKKLNERLYILRSLVPNISKLDKASILGDAITYIEDLQKEARDLQDELERNSDDEYTAHSIMTDNNQLHHKSFSAEASNVNEPMFRPEYDLEKPTASLDKAQQMEVQVEVGQLEANEFYIKVFGEQKRGGFVKLMEALNCVGLEIINVNMTSCISLVSYVFIVKKRDSENVPAEYLRDSLLEATRSGQTGFWSEMAQSSETGTGVEHRHQQGPSYRRVFPQQFSPVY